MLRSLAVSRASGPLANCNVASRVEALTYATATSIGSLGNFVGETGRPADAAGGTLFSIGIKRGKARVRFKPTSYSHVEQRLLHPMAGSQRRYAASLVHKAGRGGGGGRGKHWLPSVLILLASS